MWHSVCDDFIKMYWALRTRFQTMQHFEHTCCTALSGPLWKSACAVCPTSPAHNEWVQVFSRLYGCTGPLLGPYPGPSPPRADGLRLAPATGSVQYSGSLLSMGFS